jgi:hypothetical protein
MQAYNYSQERRTAYGNPKCKASRMDINYISELITRVKSTKDLSGYCKEFIGGRYYDRLLAPFIVNLLNTK